MPTDVIMPKLGLTMEAGTVQRWLATSGERLEAGQPLLEVETDKVVVEVEAPAPGLLGRLLVLEGENAPIGALLARIYAPGEQQEPAQAAASGVGPPASAPDPRHSQRVTPLAGPIATERASDLDRARGSSPGSRITSQDIRQAGRRERIFSSPRARKQAREAGLDWRTIPGSGPRGRVIERDVVQAATESRPATIVDRPLTNDHGPSSIVHGPSSAGEVTWEPPSPVQRVAAARLAGGFTAAPHLTFSAEARADALLELHDRLLPAVERRSGVRLTITDLLVKIAATALVEHPRANAFWDLTGGGRIGLQRGVHIGLAVATPAGLVVPVLRNAASLGMTQIASARSRLDQKAQEGELSPEDLEGSTFTLTDFGMYRVDAFQAILNPPQSAILAVGRIAERPAVAEGLLCVRPTVVVTLSCDDRVLDGVLGAQFLTRIVELIEEPWELIA
jgi:pyruvate dehydrogenase E2 component (dihydrolipoamide acetyltransferase)